MKPLLRVTQLFGIPFTALLHAVDLLHAVAR